MANDPANLVKDIDRLKQLAEAAATSLGSSDPNTPNYVEGVGLAIGILGSIAVNLSRIADAVEVNNAKRG